MAFVPWKDRVTSTPHRYKLTEVSADTYDLEAVPGSISEAGTPVNAENLNKLIQRDGDDIKNTVVAFTEASSRANIGTGESTATLFGKIKKYFTDLKTHAFTNPSTAQGTGTTTVPCDLLLKNSSFARVYREATEISGITYPVAIGVLCKALSDQNLLNTYMVIGCSAATEDKVTGLPVIGTAPQTYGQLIIRVPGTSALRMDIEYTKHTGTGAADIKWIGDLNRGTTPWSVNWKQIIDDSTAQTISGVKTYSASPLVPTTPSGPSAAVAKSYADLKAPIANPSFTGVMSCNTMLTGKYRLVPTTNSLNYYKFATVTLGTQYHAKIEGVISYHPYAGDGSVGSAKIEIALRANTLAIDIKGNSDYPVLARIGTLYATMTSDFIVSLYYKQGGQYCLPTLTITGGFNNATVTYEQTDTGSTSAPATPSGGIAVEFPYTSYKTISTPYSKVIRTQAEFEALIASATWLGAVSVALVGQFTLSTANNKGIKIPATVKQIHGYNSAKITITNFKYDSSTAKGGLWYDTRPTTADYSIRDLEVDCTGTGTLIRAFYNCIGLHNCTGTGTGGTDGFGFRNCTNLTNCTGTGTGGNGGYGFYDCNYITNCTGTGEGTTGYGFGFCTNLSNGTGTGTGGTFGCGFYNCDNLSNCTGKGEDSGDQSEGFGFYGITRASNCKDGGSDTDMWGGTNKNIDIETCRKTPVQVTSGELTTLNT